jgi:hypothetical protein
VFKPIFQRHAAGELQFAVTTVSIAEVLTGPLQSGNEAAVYGYSLDNYSAPTSVIFIVLAAPRCAAQR